MWSCPCPAKQCSSIHSASAFSLGVPVIGSHFSLLGLALVVFVPLSLPLRWDFGVQIQAQILKAETFSIEHPNPEGSQVLADPGALTL